MPFCYGQDSAETPNIPKNLIYGSFGSAIYKYTYNFFYERTFISEASSSAGIRLGGGYIEGYTNRGSNFNVQLVVVAEGLELGLGMTFREYAADKSQHKSVAFNLGYRGFTKNRVFLYRFGVSLPEAVYVGVGFGFGKRTN
jgi:hypothetical protein